MNWHQLTTQGRIEAIRSVWRPGMSGQNICDAIPGCPSRNAVMGMYHRHGDKLLDCPLQRPVSHRRRKMRKDRNPLRIVEAADPITLMELNDHTCRFPVGEITGEHQLFCGQWCDIDQPYCDHHMEIAHGPGTESERSADRVLKQASRQAA